MSKRPRTKLALTMETLRRLSSSELLAVGGQAEGAGLTPRSVLGPCASQRIVDCARTSARPRVSGSSRLPRRPRVGKERLGDDQRKHPHARSSC